MRSRTLARLPAPADEIGLGGDEFIEDRIGHFAAGAHDPGLDALYRRARKAFVSGSLAARSATPKAQAEQHHSMACW